MNIKLTRIIQSTLMVFCLIFMTLGVACVVGAYLSVHWILFCLGAYLAIHIALMAGMSALELT